MLNIAYKQNLTNKFSFTMSHMNIKCPFLKLIGNNVSASNINNLYEKFGALCPKLVSLQHESIERKNEEKEKNCELPCKVKRETHSTDLSQSIMIAIENLSNKKKNKKCPIDKILINYSKISPVFDKIYSQIDKLKYFIILLEYYNI